MITFVRVPSVETIVKAQEKLAPHVDFFFPLLISVEWPKKVTISDYGQFRCFPWPQRLFSRRAMLSLTLEFSL